MAAEDSDLERSEEPTGRRLQQARDQGQIARSQELSAALVVIAAMSCFYFFGADMMENLVQHFAQAFRFELRTLEKPTLLPVTLARFLIESFLIIWPILLVTLIMGVVASVAMGGFNFAWGALEPKFDRLNPINGIGRLFGMDAVVNLVKAVLKFSVVATGMYWVLQDQLDDYLRLSSMNFEPAMGLAGDLISEAALMVALGLLLIALVDVPYQKIQFMQRMRMTKQEVKDEMKDTEGRPEVKSQIRRRQREMAANRMIDKVKDADVVVTNPEHFAVALSYDPSGNDAPIVLAKGADHLAFRIREEAKKNGVEVFSAPPLARALFYTCDLDRPIHHELYYAVAQVIAYVFGLQGLRPGTQRPQRPDPTVPDGMLFDTNGRPLKAD
jgi:flagellar biosynthetic protein FlhB